MQITKSGLETRKLDNDSGLFWVYAFG